MTPKEALEKLVKNVVTSTDEETWKLLTEDSKYPLKQLEEYKLIVQTLTELEALKRYPTADEVCEALSEYHLFDMVEYDKKTQTFYSGDNICYMGIDYQDKPIIIFDYELPPHLITLIGRFYEGLK